MKPLAILDYETEEILRRPIFPPKPVGASIILQGKRPEYLAWGHPTENNCTMVEAKRKIKDIYKNYRIVMHHAKFDLEVGEKWFDLPLDPPHGFECTMLLSFLHNPRESSLELKDLAIRHLGMNANEQDKLREWLLANVKGVKQAKTKWGRYISLAPGKLAGRYANKDTRMTKGLYKRSMPYIIEMNMIEQYEIEKRVVLKAIKMERGGVKIDEQALRPALAKAKKAQQRHRRALTKVLGDVNFNSGPQKAAAFERAGLVDEWEYTDKGNPKTGIDSLIEVCNDANVVKHLEMFSKYNKTIGTYMEPWLKSAEENNGYFFPYFNTTRNEQDKGTYTGRFSSNFQQVPRVPDKRFKNYPHLRNYIVPDKKSHLLYVRDVAQQELRILAHFEDGIMLAAYLADPKLCMHNHVKFLIAQVSGISLLRPYVKTCNFLIVYGGGYKALMAQLKKQGLVIEEDKAREILKLHGQALPGVKDLKDDLLVMSRKEQSFKTVGGRWYTSNYQQPYIDLNTLVQGSAADHTKRMMVQIDDMLIDEFQDARMTLTVHDEFQVTGPKGQRKKLMKRFKEEMEDDKLMDLPMPSDGKIGERWGSMTKCV